MKFIIFLILLSAPLRAVVWHDDMTDKDSRDLAWSEDAFSATCRITVRDKTGKVSIRGTGVLIADRWVLTAKHLLKENTDSKNITCEFERRQGGKREIRLSASFATHAPDIAVIELRENAPAWVPRVPPYPHEDEVESGVVFTKVGYGGIDSRSSDSNIRRAITNTYATASDDWLHYQRNDKGSDRSKSSKWEGSTAPGDSGGPAFIFKDNQWWISSVTFGVLREAGPRETRVSTRIDWIRKATKLPFPVLEDRSSK